jgi:hypothetical protein
MAPWAEPDPEAQAEGARVHRIMQGPALPATAPQPPDPSAIRARLTGAIAARAAANVALDEANAAVARAEKLEKDAQGTYDVFAGLDDRIVDLRSDELADWARHGDGAPPPEFTLPEDLREERRRRDEAGAALTGAIDAVVKLRREANEAQEAATEAGARVTYVIAELLAAEAAVRAADLAEDKRRVSVDEDRLSALAGLWIGGRALPLSSSVGAALAMTKERLAADRMPNMPRAAEHERELWEDYARRLQTDPEARWEWRAPQPRPWPDQARMIGAIPPFVPTSLRAFRQFEAERLEAEAKAEAAGPPPFVPEAAWTAAQKFRAEKAQREAERAEMELTVAAAEARRGST